ncbi:MAG: hypothetical protein Q9160_006025 [Pyrenula sp. 1 TL-2023]
MHAINALINDFQRSVAMTHECLAQKVNTMPHMAFLNINRKFLVTDLVSVQSCIVVSPIAATKSVLSLQQINILMSLQAIHRYKIASHIGIDESVSFQEISKRCSLEESDVRRLLRMATANYVFCEPRKGVIAHTAMSKLLLQDHLVHQWVGIVCDEMWPSGCRMIDAMTRWPGSQEPNETGVGLANPTGESLFEMLARDPERARRFADAMKFLQSAPSFSVEHLFNDLGWDVDTSPRLLVDMGGSHGSIAIELMRKFPAIKKCVVQDLPETIDGARVPSDLEGRLEFQAHNFFTQQPVKGADVYLLRSILHDWSEKYAIQILKNLIPALKTRAKLVLNELCLPEPNVLPFYLERLLRYG